MSLNRHECARHMCGAIKFEIKKRVKKMTNILVLFLLGGFHTVDITMSFCLHIRFHFIETLYCQHNFFSMYESAMNFKHSNALRLKEN